MNFLALVAVSLAALLLAFGPIFVSSILHDTSEQNSFTFHNVIGSVHKQMTQILSRLFPWQRGLCHAYWAPNIWAWYSAADRVLIRAIRILKLPILSNSTVAEESVGSTGGLVQVVSMVVLPNIKPAFTFFATIMSMGPVLWKVSVDVLSSFFGFWARQELVYLLSAAKNASIQSDLKTTTPQQLQDPHNFLLTYFLLLLFFFF